MDARLKKQLTYYFGLSLFVLLFDQLTKMLTHFYMVRGEAGQILLLGDWLKLHYILNPGMAFGMELGGDNGKLWLTSFRILAMIAIGWYVVQLVKSKAHKAYITCMALVLGGAVGNLFDSIFYGVLLDNAPAGSPSPWLHGQVVDMIYVDIWQGFLPDWMPIFGGQYYAFWPIFNVADATIFCSVITLLIFGQRWMSRSETDKLGSSQSQDPQPLA
jgi:signal peptidase II